MTQNLARINRVLATRWYDLLIPDADLAALQERLSDDPAGGKPLGMHRRNLYRVFNDRELTTGGRFYGGWWQSVPKAYRRHLAVNGKRMVEIDYSNLHPVILYAEAGATPPVDCYRGIFDEVTETKGGAELRSMVKATFNAMLNAERPLRQAPKGIEPGKFNMSWPSVSNAVRSAHGPIENKFYTGAGKRLQRTDSDVAERVMLDFIESGIPILPVHDSFLVHEGHREFLNKSMQSALVEVCGVETKLKVIDADLSSVVAEQAADRAKDPEDFGPQTSLDISEILSSQEGYDRRLDAFFNIEQA
ncbi:hypothetical protein G0Q01_23475 [Yangia sp. PrR007]|nr:hypothetical protein [Salipiger sp. PrR003]NDW35201.1 hypothetical protein [Salipiger sp. PrR007]